MKLVTLLEEGMYLIVIALFPFIGIRLYSFRRRCYAVCSMTACVAPCARWRFLRGNENK